MGDIIKMGLKLLLITSVAALALGLTNILTEQPIAMQIERANTEARMSVLPSAQEFNNLDADLKEYPAIQEIFEGVADGYVVGYTFKVVGRGYGGEMEVIVGINLEGNVEAIKVGQHQETPGLGARATDALFQNQYRGKSADKPLEYNEVSAITGATMTSDAVTRAVNEAISYRQAELATGGAAQ